jgi:hypothetical protein
MSTGMVNLLIRLLAMKPDLRPATIRDMMKDLNELKTLLLKVPKILLEGFEHIPTDNDLIWNDDYVLDLKEFELNDFSLQYLYKFLPASNIPNICLFGGAMPIRGLSKNTITTVNLQDQGLYAEDLKALSPFLEMNISLKSLDLSKNPIMQRHGISNIKNKGEVDYCESGFKYFLRALDNNTDLIKLNLSNVSMNIDLTVALCSPLAKNINLNDLNLSSCDLGPHGCEIVCNTISSFKNLHYVNLSNNNAQSQGAMHIANLLNVNHHILEIDLFNN